jgi:hypothetical protein
MKPTTIRGPGLFISQFIGAGPPFDRLGDLAAWARFIDEQIVRVSERSFDAALDESMSPEKLDRVLGIARN